MENEFETQLNRHIKSMIEISFEFVDWNENEIERIYVLCSTEGSNFFTFFYSIRGVIVKRHLVNSYLKKKCNVEPAKQISSDRIGLKDLRSIVDLFKLYDKEIPMLIKIDFNILTSNMNMELSYEKRL